MPEKMGVSCMYHIISYILHLWMYVATGLQIHLKLEFSYLSSQSLKHCRYFECLLEVLLTDCMDWWCHGHHMTRLVMWQVTGDYRMVVGISGVVVDVQGRLYPMFKLKVLSSRHKILVWSKGNRWPVSLMCSHMADQPSHVTTMISSVSEQDP